MLNITTAMKSRSHEPLPCHQGIGYNSRRGLLHNIRSSLMVLAVMSTMMNTVKEMKQRLTLVMLKAVVTDEEGGDE